MGSSPNRSKIEGAGGRGDDAGGTVRPRRHPANRLLIFLLPGQSRQVNLRYGNEAGVLFYTHISD
jgi:hypothetical protein